MRGINLSELTMPEEAAANATVAMTTIRGGLRRQGQQLHVAAGTSWTDESIVPEPLPDWPHAYQVWP